MSRLTRLLSLPALVLLGLAHPHLTAAIGERAGEADAADTALPMYFEPNRGQADRHVRFIGRGPSYTVLLRADEAVLRLPSRSGRPEDDRTIRIHVLGANGSAPMVGHTPLPGRVSYLIGSDPHLWHRDIPTFGQVTVRNVYPGTSLVYYAHQGGMEYDWRLAPHADPGVIHQTIEGADALRLDAGGNLLVRAGNQTVRLGRPTAFQVDAHGRQPVQAAFTLGKAGAIGLRIGHYDRAEPLVVDPTLVYSTFLGGHDEDGAASVAVDAQGNAYVTGDTESPDFPTEHPEQSKLSSDRSCASAGIGLQNCTDAFVSKIAPDGKQLLYSTYLGGSLDDYGHGIAVDRSGQVYLTGSTLSRDFPVKAAAQARWGGGTTMGDAFVTKLNRRGDGIIYSTYLGGRGDDDGEALVVKAGNVYLTGSTASANFPHIHAIQAQYRGGQCAGDDGRTACTDAFIARVASHGQLVFSTFLGGARADAGWGIGVQRGSVYVAGTTTSSDFPMRDPFQATFGGGTCGVEGASEPCTDAFFARLTINGASLLASSYLGGTGTDRANDLAVDASGDAYIVGETESRNFPLLHPIESRFHAGFGMAFVTKVAASDSRMAWSTYLGGSGGDEAYGVAVDGTDDVYVTGTTMSDDFPIVAPVQRSLSSADNVQNAFVTEIDPQGSAFVYSTYLGGKDHDLGGHIAVDSVGDAYITGFATSSNFPLAHAIQRRHHGGTFDAFVAEIRGPRPVRQTRTGKGR